MRYTDISPPLACLLLLTACPEAEHDEPVRERDDAVSEPEPEEEASDDPDEADAGAHDPSDSGARPGQDASSNEPDADEPDAGDPPAATGGARFFLRTPEPDNTAAPRVELDGEGNVHAVFPAYAGGGAYYTFCATGDCEQAEDFEVVQLDTDGTVGNAMLALTADGKPRVLLSSYLSVYVWDSEALNAGVDLALDPDDKPRIAHTINYDIVLTYCDSASCTAEDSVWDSSHVERGSEIPADQIFLEWNCTIGAWFLHSPSIAIDAAGKPRVGYQSRDVSGGTSWPDPTKPRCVAGTDMTWTRLALMSSYK